MPSSARPNILLFVTDQQQWQTICGRSPARTPNVDRLAAEGMRFERPYVTTALCCPSRASLLSGQFPSHHGVLNMISSPERVRTDLYPGIHTYSQHLRDAGYQLGYVGKWHVSWDRTPLDFGFHDLRVPAACNPSTLRAAGFGDDLLIARGGELARLGDPPRPGDPSSGFSDTVEVECTVTWPGAAPHLVYGINHASEEETAGYVQTSHAIELIEQYAGKAPWHIAVNPFEPHDPYTPLAPYAARYDPADVPLPASWHDDFVGKPNLNRREASLWDELTEDHVRTAIARYWASCEQVDAQVGRVIEALDRTGQAEDTLVVFTADHGDMLGAHRQFLKGWQPYEETYRVPLVMRWPAVIAPGGVCEHLVQLHELAHTFVDVAGAEPIQPPDGRSLTTLFLDPSREGWEDVAFCQYYGDELLYTQRMVMTPRFKYVFNGWDFDELYDLEADPHELRNVLDDPVHSPTRDAMRALLYQQMERYGDPYAQHRYGAARYLPRPGVRVGMLPASGAARPQALST